MDTISRSSIGPAALAATLATGALAGCGVDRPDRVGPIARLEVARVVVLRAPRQQQNCFEDFAVSLDLDHVFTSP